MTSISRTTADRGDERDELAAGPVGGHDGSTRGRSADLTCAGPSRARCWRHGGPRTGGLTDEMVALGDVRGPAGGRRVRRRGGREVAAELVQVTTDGVPPVSLAEHLAHPVGLAPPGRGGEDVADRD